MAMLRQKSVDIPILDTSHSVPVARYQNLATSDSIILAQYDPGWPICHCPSSKLPRSSNASKNDFPQPIERLHPSPCGVAVSSELGNVNLGPVLLHDGVRNRLVPAL